MPSDAIVPPKDAVVARSTASVMPEDKIEPPFDSAPDPDPMFNEDVRGTGLLDVLAAILPERPSDAE